MGKMKKKQLAEELNTEMTAVVALEIEKRQDDECAEQDPQ